MAIKYTDVPKLFFALSLETVSDAGEQYSILALLQKFTLPYSARISTLVHVKIAIGERHELIGYCDGGSSHKDGTVFPSDDLPPMVVPPVMLVRQAWGQSRPARGPQAPAAPAAGSPKSCVGPALL